MPHGRTRYRYLLAVVASAACFSTLAILTNKAYAYGIRPLPLLAWRFAIVAVVMAALQAIRAPRELAITTREFGRFSLLALGGYGSASVCFFYALLYADASVVAVLLYTYPALVAVLARVTLGEPLGLTRMAAIGVTFAGCALVLGLPSGGIVRPAGIALGLGAALGYAIFNVGSYRWVLGHSRTVLMTYMFGVAAIAIGAIALASGQRMSPAGWAPALWGYLGLIVVVPTLLALQLYFGGMRGLGPAQASIVASLEPLFTILLAAWLLGERLMPLQWAGAGLVVLGVALAEWRSGAGPNENAPMPDELATV